MGARVSSVEIAHPNKEEAHKVKMQEVAEHIVRDPPSWLRDLLSDFSFEVYSAYSIDTIWPTRTQMRDSLAETGTLAVQLSDVLKNSPMVGFLASYSDMKSEDFVRDLISSLSKLATCARQARSAPQLIEIGGELRRGPGKPRLPGEMPPRYVCSAIIAEVWAFFHGDEDPAPSNRRAWIAADKFWLSWIRQTNSWGTDPLTKWKRYFEGICEADLKPLRKEVRRHLNIRSTLAALMPENNGA